MNFRKRWKLVVFDLLCAVSLLLGILAGIFWLIATIQPRYRVTQRWTDAGNIVRCETHVHGWSSRGIYQDDIHSYFEFPTSAAAQPFKDFFAKGAPADATSIRWVDDYNRMLDPGIAVTQIYARIAATGSGWESFSAPLFYLAILPAVWLLRRLMRWYDHHRRWRPGLCRHCFYDLRGNESGICSECGRGYASRRVVR